MNTSDLRPPTGRLEAALSTLSAIQIADDRYAFLYEGIWYSISAEDAIDGERDDYSGVPMPEWWTPEARTVPVRSHNAAGHLETHTGTADIYTGQEVLL